MDSLNGASTHLGAKARHPPSSNGGRERTCAGGDEDRESWLAGEGSLRFSEISDATEVDQTLGSWSAGVMIMLGRGGGPGRTRSRHCEWRSKSCVVVAASREGGTNGSTPWGTIPVDLRVEGSLSNR